MFFSFSLIEDSRYAEEAKKLKVTILCKYSLLNQKIFIAVTLACASVCNREIHI